MTQTQTPEPQEPIEVRYFTPGKGWGRRTFRTQAAFERWLDKLDDDVEVRVAS